MSWMVKAAIGLVALAVMARVAATALETAALPGWLARAAVLAAVGAALVAGAVLALRGVRADG